VAAALSPLSVRMPGKRKNKKSVKTLPWSRTRDILGSLKNKRKRWKF